MVGEHTTQQVCALSRDGLSAEQISEALGVPIEQVKLALSANQLGSEADRDINDEQLAALRTKAFQLAMYSPEDTVAARMTMFLIERDRPSKKAEQLSPIVAINKALVVAQQNFTNLIEEYKS